MIKRFIKKFEENRGGIREEIGRLKRVTYKGLFEILCANIGLDHELVSTIDHGSFSGNMLFIVPEMNDYGKYYCCMIRYGSCSACDTLKGIMNMKEEKEREDQLMTLVVHMLQGMKQISGVEE